MIIYYTSKNTKVIIYYISKKYKSDYLLYKHKRKSGYLSYKQKIQVIIYYISINAKGWDKTRIRMAWIRIRMGG